MPSKSLTNGKIGNDTMLLGENSEIKFPCGREVGWEKLDFRLPDSMVAENGAVVQLEFETEYGTIVQCSDMIIEPFNEF
jgi:hypothetical protein